MMTTDSEKATDGSAAADNTAEGNGSPAAGAATGTAESAGGAPADLSAQLKEQQNKYLYLYAEFENYKKRAFKERSELIKFGHEHFARELLQVSDNLDRALEHANSQDALVSGIRMVNQQLKDTMSKFGIVPMTTLGQKFDPSIHEAIGQEKITTHSNEQAEGSVLREHQKGYTLHGRLLRPARVVVATK